MLSGPLSLGGTFSGAGGGTNNFDAANTTVTAGGDVTLTNIASFISTGSTPAVPSFIFNGTTTLTSAGKSFNNITIGAGAGASLVLSGPLSLGGTFSGAVGGTNNFDAANTTVTAGGNVTLTNIASFISTGSTPAVPSFIFNGTTTLTCAGKSFNNITIGAGAGASLVLSGPLSLGGTFSGAAGGTNNFDAANTTVTAGGNVTLTNIASFISTGSTPALPSFIFNGTTTLTSAGKSFNNITIGAGAGASLVLSGPLSLGGTFSGAAGGTNNFDAANTTVTAGGNVTLTNIASFISTGSTPAVPSFIFNGTTTLTSAGKSFNNITIGAGAGGTLTLFPTNATGDMVVLGAIAVTAGGTTAFDTTNRTVTVAGNVTFTGLTTFTSTGSSFVFNGTTTLTSAGKSFNNITIGAGAGASLVLSGPLSLGGTFSGAAGGTNNFDAANNAVTAGGNVTLTNIASFISTGSTPAVPSFVFNGTTTLTSAGKSFNNITIGAGAGGTLTLFPTNATGDLVVLGAISVTAGGTTAFDTTNRTVTVAGNVTFTGLTTFTSTGSTFVFNGTTTLTSAGKSFNNITIGAGSGASLVLSGPLSLGGTFSGAAGGTNNFDAANTTVTAGGNVTLTNIASFISTGSTPAVPSFIFNGTTTLTSAAKSFNNITIGAGAGGTLTLFPTNATGDLVVLGAISVTGGGTTAFNTTSRTVTVAGNVTFTGLTTFTSTGSTFVFNGTTTLTSAGKSFNTITIGAGAGGSLVLSGPLSLSGTFSGAAGGTNNFDAANTTVTAGGNVTLTNIASFISTGSTPAVPSFIFNGTTTLTSAGKSFNNITIGAGAGGTLTLFPTNATGDMVVLGAISVTGGGTTAFDTTNRTVTVAGNVTFTGLTTFTSTGSTFVFNGTTTLTSAGKSFNNVQVGTGTISATVTLLDAAALLNGSGVLSMTQGSLNLNAQTLTLGTSLDMSSGTVAQLTVGTGTLDAATNGKTVTVGNANATVTQSTGTLSAVSLTVSAGAYTLTGAGSVTLGSGGLTQSGGTITASSAGIASSGNVDVQAAGAFNENTSTLTMTGAGTIVHFAQSPLHQPHNLTISAAGTVAISTEALTVGNNLTVSTGATFGTATFNLTVGGNLDSSGTLDGSSGKSISVTGNTTCAGTINLLNGSYTTNNLTVSGVTPAGLVASGSELITVLGNLDFSAAGTNYTPVTSTIVMGGTATPVTLNSPPAEDPFYELTINKGALGQTVVLASAITITHSLTITRGTLSAGSHLITMQGVIWDNVGSYTGVGFFNPGTGTVLFTTATTIQIMGDNSWYNFSCTTDGKIFQFEHLRTQTILAGGNFSVYASTNSPVSSMITLTTDNPIATANGSPPPALQGQWVINNLSMVAQVIDNVNVSWSYALVTITPGPGAVDSGNNFNWNFVIPIIASWTLDTNNNGRIDRIRVQVKQGTQLANAFGGITVQVDGYGQISGASNFTLPGRQQGRVRHHPPRGTIRKLQCHPHLAGHFEHEPLRDSRRRPGGPQYAHPGQDIRRRKRRTARDHLHRCRPRSHTRVRALLRAGIRQLHRDGANRQRKPQLLRRSNHCSAGGDDR